MVDLGLRSRVASRREAAIRARLTSAGSVPAAYRKGEPSGSLHLQARAGRRDAGRPADAQRCGARLASGNTITLGPNRMLRVVATRVEEGSDGDPVSVLVVEDAWPTGPLAP
jgi:hypothetical protein